MDFEGLNKIAKMLSEYSEYFDKYRITPEAELALKNFSSAAKAITDKVRTDILSDEIKTYLNTLKEDEHLSQEEFERKYVHEKSVCEHLGRAGWVVTEHGNPKEVEEWNELLSNDKEKDISQYFTGDSQFVQTAIIDGLSKRYVDGEARVYFQRGLKYYNLNDYMTSAMYIVGLLEQRCKALSDFGEYKRYKVVFSNVGFEKHLHEKYGKINGQLTKRYLFLEMYPSLIAFLNRLFDDGEYTFEKGIEPPYINRNWLLHGKTTRNIEEYECIQLFNALSVLEFVCDIGKEFKE